MGFLKSFRIQEVPLSLAYIAAVLEKNGHVVSIIDMNVINSHHDFLSKAKEKDYELIGLTATTPIINNCLRTIKILKKLHPRARIVLGGWHATAMPVETMKICRDLDIIVKGEGEATIKELVEALTNQRSLHDLQGILYRNEAGDIVENPDRPLIEDIDSIPFPARHLLPIEDYQKMGVSFITYDASSLQYDKSKGYPNVTHMLTSRGCYNRCTFCADHIIYKQKIRFHSPEHVVAEIKDAISRFNIRIFNILDPVFLLNQNRIRAICKLIIKEKLSIQWCCQGRVAEKVSFETLDLMRRAGCEKIYYGIESGSPRVLKAINKNITIKQIRDTIANTKKAGIPSHVFFLYGFPGETMDDYYYTRQLINEVKPNSIEVHEVIPLPGTDLFASELAANNLDTSSWDRYHYYTQKSFHAKKMTKQQLAVRKKFFSLSKQFNISPHYFFGFIRKIKTLEYFFAIVKGFRMFIEYHVFIKRLLP